MLGTRYIFTLASFLLLKRSSNYVESVPAITNTNIITAESAIRVTANTLFYALGVRNVQLKPRLHHYAMVHNYFISQTLQTNENLKEITKLTRVDKSNKRNTTDFIALVNEILNEDNVLKLQNIIMGESSIPKYDIESEIEKLDFLKKYHAERYNKSMERNEDILKKQNASLKLKNITKTRRNCENIDEIPFWTEDNVLPERRIYRGKRTKIKKFPFMASIQIFGKFQCAGSIIHSDLVITAASCLQLAWNNRFYRENPEFLSVRVGSSFYEVGGDNIEVLEIYFYPSYDPKVLRHNIAIIRLSRKIRMKRHRVKKIELADTFGDNIAKVLVVGWGAHTFGNQAHSPWIDKMRSSALDYYGLDECLDIYSKNYITQQNFCAGFSSVGGGACNRDVGGPGIISGKLAGVISFGAPQCGKPDAPTVFTKLTYYTDWIEEIMEQNVPWIMQTTTRKPVTHPFVIYKGISESNDIKSVTPITSQSQNVQNYKTMYAQEKEINQPGKKYSSRENIDIIRQKQPAVKFEKNGSVKEEIEFRNKSVKSDTEEFLRTDTHRITVIDYVEYTRAGYETKNDSSKTQAKKYSHKTTYIENTQIHSNLANEIQIKNISSTYEPRYIKPLNKPEGYFEQNVTTHADVINLPAVKLEQNEEKEEEIISGYKSFDEESDSEETIQTAIDYEKHSKTGYGIKVNSNQIKTTINSHKPIYLENSKKDSKLAYEIQVNNVNNSHEPRYTKPKNEPERYLGQNVTKPISLENFQKYSKSAYEIQIKNISSSRKPGYPKPLNESEGYLEQNVTKHLNVINLPAIKLEQNEAMEEEIMSGNKSYSEESDSEESIQTAIDYEKYSKAGYDTKIDSSRPQATINSNNPIYLENSQKDSKYRNKLDTTPYFDFTLKLNEKHKPLYPEILIGNMEKTEKKYEKHATKIIARASLQESTKTQTIKTTTLITDNIQTTTVKSNKTPPLFRNLLKETQSLYQLMHTENPINKHIGVKKDTSEVTRASIETLNDDEAVYLEPLIEGQEMPTTDQKLLVNYQEEVKFANQDMRKQDKEDEQNIVEFIAHRLLLSKEEEGAEAVHQETQKQMQEQVNKESQTQIQEGVNQEPQKQIRELARKANKAHNQTNLTNHEPFKQVQTVERDNSAHYSQAGEESSLAQEKVELNRWIQFLQIEANKNLENKRPPTQDHKEAKFENQTDSLQENQNLAKQEIYILYENVGKLDGQKKTTITEEDTIMNLSNQDSPKKGQKKAKFKSHTGKLAEKSINSPNSNSLTQIQERDIQINQNNSTLDEENMNSSNLEHLREDYEEDRLDYQANYIIVDEGNKLANSELLRKSHEEDEFDHQTDSMLVNEGITNQERPIKSQVEVKLYSQENSAFVDDIISLVQLESLKKDQEEGKLDNQTDFIISDEKINIIKQKFPTQGQEVANLGVAKYGDQAQSLNSNENISINPTGFPFRTQTQELSNSALLTYQEHLNTKKGSNFANRDSIYVQEESNLSQTENRAYSQNDESNIETKKIKQPMRKKAQKNVILIKKAVKVAEQVLQNQAQTSKSLNPLLRIPQKSFDAPSHMYNRKDFPKLTQEVTYEQKKEPEVMKIKNEMDTEMKNFLNNKIDKAVLSLLYPPNNNSGEVHFKHIDRNVTILLAYDDIVESKSTFNRNSTQPNEKPINDKILKTRKELEGNSELVNMHNQQQSGMKKKLLTRIIKEPSVVGKDIKRQLPPFKVPVKVEQGIIQIKNTSDELYSEENTDNLDDTNHEKVLKARRAMNFLANSKQSESIELEEENRPEVSIKLDSKEGEAIKKNILDYINI